MKEMIASLMVLYKVRIEQDWQLCCIHPSTGKHPVLLSFTGQLMPLLLKIKSKDDVVYGGSLQNSFEKVQ